VEYIHVAFQCPVIGIRERDNEQEISWAAWRLKMEPISCPETSGTNYQSMLRKIPEERRPQKMFSHYSLSGLYTV
jgi:hypothetical protein